jgi:hypothetical protein
MFIEFDQTTIDNMTVALEYVCDKLPRNKDTHENRKRIADAMIASARSGKHSVRDFQRLGSKTVQEIAGTSRGLDPGQRHQREGGVNPPTG